MVRSTYTLTLWQRICFGFIFGLAYLFSLLPFYVLYFISEVLYILTYYIIGYRKKLVRKHLVDSFPEKSERERRHIEHSFYHWFCDYIVEMLKLISISKKTMRRHMVFHHTEIVQKCIDNGQGVALFLGHYCNWEWISSIPLWLDGNNYAGAQVYHVLESPVMDKLLLYPRHRMGPDNVAIMDVLRYILANKEAGRPPVIGFIADQVPFWNNIGGWLTFLNHQQTPVLTGTERLARRFNMACIYIDVRRLSRGFYKADFQLITDRPQEMPELSITEDYFRRLEQSIQRQPAYWLWTHNRWKRTREEYDLMVDPVTGKLKM